MTHLGQRLSALIDGELDCDERDRVLGHLARCGWCRDEASALRTLKRRMNALGETAAGAGLTGRLMDLSSAAEAAMWPPTASCWPAGEPAARPDAKGAGRYLLAASFAVFLAGLGTAAFIAGGEPQAQAPAPRVTPSVDVLLFEHEGIDGMYVVNGLAQPKPSRSSSLDRSRQLP